MCIGHIRQETVFRLSMVSTTPPPLPWYIISTVSWAIIITITMITNAREDVLEVPVSWSQDNIFLWNKKSIDHELMCRPSSSARKIANCNKQEDNSWQLWAAKFGQCEKEDYEVKQKQPGFHNIRWGSGDRFYTEEECLNTQQKLQYFDIQGCISGFWCQHFHFLHYSRFSITIIQLISSFEIAQSTLESIT